ncbi:MAG TPA: DUF4214 domain-containing protein [Geobacteraceae bacterium]|nr:DUF4214 domain-containing protein [Geobacteraceae bacterium]
MKTYTQAVCCIATRSYLPRLIVLYNSILEYQDIPLYLLAVDIDPDETSEITTQLSGFFPESARGMLHVISPFEIYGQAFHQMRFYYDIFELSNACKGGILNWMQRNTSIERWLYLDCDILCRGELEPFFTALDTSAILLTPHRDKPCATALGDINYLISGTFNAGVIGVRRSPESQVFTEWLYHVLSHYCLLDLPLPIQDRFIQSTSLAADQLWLNLVPAYFSGVTMVSERGLNLGHWNADEGRLTRRDGKLYIGEDRITLLHLSGWLADQPGRLSKHSSLDWSDNPVWIDLHNRYKELLASLEGKFTGINHSDTYSDGVPIPTMHRRAYLRHLLDGLPPLEVFSRENVANIVAHYEEQRKSTSDYYKLREKLDQVILAAGERLDQVNLAAAIQQYRLAHRPIIGWLLRLLTNYYSDNSRHLVENLLASDDKTFINKTYLSLLNRTPDTVGAEHYSSRLREGMPRIKMFEDLCNSQEYMSKMKC